MEGNSHQQTGLATGTIANDDELAADLSHGDGSYLCWRWREGREMASSNSVEAWGQSVALWLNREGCQDSTDEEEEMKSAGRDVVDARGGKTMDENEMDGWGEENRAPTGRGLGMDRAGWVWLWEEDGRQYENEHGFHGELAGQLQWMAGLGRPLSGLLHSAVYSS